MILTILKYFVIAVAVGLGIAFLVLLGAALAATIVMIAEDSEYPKKEVHKEELTDGDNEA